MLSPHQKQSITINIRAKASQIDMIDLAAEKQGRSRSEFILDAAYREAQDVLLDQSFFAVDEGTFDQLYSLIEEPLPPTDKLRRLLSTKAPWDNQK